MLPFADACDVYGPDALRVICAEIPRCGAVATPVPKGT